eukprot:5685031-Karenia_brevis.AAC.1
MLEANMKGETTITSTEIKVLLEDSIDAVKVKPSKKKASFGKEESIAYMNFLPPEPSSEELPGPKQLPIVDIFKDPGIW